MRVVESGLSAIIIALDGSTQEIYQAYRKGGEVNKVRRCAALIEEAKSKRGSRSPYTCLRAVVTCDNETDLAELEALSRDLGVDMFSYKTLGMQTYDKIYGEFEPKEPHMKRFEYSGSDRKPGDPIKCPFPFRQPTVFWDGTVVGCEYDYDLDMTWGKIGKDKFSDIINSPQARRLRRRIRNGTRSSFCHRVCPFQDRVQDECYLCCKALGE
jgi:MoaA/NifB/PqqE/SkfB family radical SAM enzyme